MIVLFYNVTSFFCYVFLMVPFLFYDFNMILLRFCYDFTSFFLRFFYGVSSTMFYALFMFVYVFATFFYKNITKNVAIEALKKKKNIQKS